jgi:hypothetical protein
MKADIKNLDVFRARAARALADIHLGNDQKPTEWDGVRLSPDEFPAPHLVLFTLRDLLGLKAMGRREKVAWSLVASFKGVPFEVSLRKFGFQYIVPEDTPEDIRQQLVASLKKAAELAASCLKTFAEEQMVLANVTIENQYRVFDGAYRFFREQAKNGYENAPSGPLDALLDPTLSQAGYCAGAMLNAYFSLLEHLLVLVLPFTGFEPGDGALRRFASETWDIKFAKLFDLENDTTARRIREILGGIKKRFRNPISHGGFDKEGTLFHFHVPGLSSLPALLTKYEVSIERYVTPIPRAVFETLCGQLDECDRLLEESVIGPGVRYARVCLPVSFSKGFRDRCRAAAQSPEVLEALIEQQIEVMDRHVNMDY